MANTTTQNSSGAKLVLALTLLIAVLAGAFLLLNQPDRRTTGERLEDAAQELSGGVTNAARELEDRTPAERAGDAVRDAGENIRENVNGQ